MTVLVTRKELPVTVTTLLLVIVAVPVPWIVPACSVRFPVNRTAPWIVRPDDPALAFIVRFLMVEVAVVELSVSDVVFKIKVPSTVMLSIGPIATESLVFTVNALPMHTMSVAPGTVPVLQLPAVVQKPSPAVPVHESVQACAIGPPIRKIPRASSNSRFMVFSCNLGATSGATVTNGRWSKKITNGESPCDPTRLLNPSTRTRGSNRFR